MANKKALPEDFPGRKALEAAGIKSADELRGKTEQELTDIDGVGPKTAAEIVAALESEGGESAAAGGEESGRVRQVTDKTGTTNRVS